MKNKIVKHFYVREAKKDRKGESPIYLRITVNGERAEISTDRRVNPGNWDKAAERVAGRSEPARIINTSLDNLVTKVEKYFSNLDVKDEIISVHQITAELKGKSQNQMTLVKVYESHIARLEELIGVDYVRSRILPPFLPCFETRSMLAYVIYNLNLKATQLIFIDSQNVSLKTLAFCQRNFCIKNKGDSDFGTQRTIFGTHRTMGY